MMATTNVAGPSGHGQGQRVVGSGVQTITSTGHSMTPLPDSPFGDIPSYEGHALSSNYAAYLPSDSTGYARRQTSGDTTLQGAGEMLVGTGTVTNKSISCEVIAPATVGARSFQTSSQQTASYGMYTTMHTKPYNHYSNLLEPSTDLFGSPEEAAQPHYYGSTSHGRSNQHQQTQEQHQQQRQLQIHSSGGVEVELNAYMRTHGFTDEIREHDQHTGQRPTLTGQTPWSEYDQ